MSIKQVVNMAYNNTRHNIALQMLDAFDQTKVGKKMIIREKYDIGSCNLTQIG